MNEKYGFVYVWYDRWRKMFYVGSHWGTEDDGYICSSNRMRDAYRRRPNDFKRRVIARVDDRLELLDEEFKWLDLISEKELGKKYYNLEKRKFGHWSTDKRKLKTVGDKISSALRGKPNLKNREKVRTPEVRAKISAKLKGRPINYVRTEKTRNLISENNKRLQKEGKIGTRGMKYSEESRAKMSAWQIGRRWYKCQETGKRVFYRDNI